RTDSDIGAARDLFEARLRPRFRKRRLSRLKQAVAIALGVGAGLARCAERIPTAAMAGATRHVAAQILRVLLPNGGSLRISNGGILRLFLPGASGNSPPRRSGNNLRLLNLEITHVQILWSRVHHRRGAGRREVERQARAGDRRISRPWR